MRLQIEDIQIGPRIRQTAGDVSALKSSIRQIGLLNPILINEQNELISGFRRLQACRQLGWTEVDVKVIDTSDDDIKKLDIEFHENLGRMNLSGEEEEDYSQTRYQLLHPPQPKSSFWHWFAQFWAILRSLFKRQTIKKES